MWFVLYFTGEPVQEPLLHRVTADKKNQQERALLIPYCLVVIYLLETYAIDGVSAEAEAEIILFKQLDGISAIRESQALQEKTLRIGILYNKPGLKPIFMEGLQPCIK